MGDSLGICHVGVEGRGRHTAESVSHWGCQSQIPAGKDGQRARLTCPGQQMMYLELLLQRTQGWKIPDEPNNPGKVRPDLAKSKGNQAGERMNDKANDFSGEELITDVAYTTC